MRRLSGVFLEHLARISSPADRHHKVDFAVLLQPVLHLQMGDLPVHHHGDIRADFIPLAQPLPNPGKLRFEGLDRLTHAGG